MLSPNLWHLAGKMLKKDMAQRMLAEVSPLLTVMYQLLNLNICHDAFWKQDVWKMCNIILVSMSVGNDWEFAVP
jgi:hypothetical protein